MKMEETGASFSFPTAKPRKKNLKRIFAETSVRNAFAGSYRVTARTRARKLQDYPETLLIYEHTGFSPGGCWKLNTRKYGLRSNSHISTASRLTLTRRFFGRATKNRPSATFRVS